MDAREPKSPCSTPPIHTIGYGQRSFDEFVEVLKRYDIAYLIDVRSHPHSRWKPQFNQGALRDALEPHRIRYTFMGDQLGGRPRDASCYRNDKVDYAIVRERDWFQRGIDRLVEAHEQGRRLAVTCAEQKPEQCHRFFLIAPELAQQGVPFTHIDETGAARSHEEITQRLTGGQLTLLPEAAQRSPQPSPRRTS